MTMADEELSGAELERLLARSKARGRQIRTRRRSLALACAVVLLGAVVTPLALLGRPSPSNEQGRPAAAFSLVAWHAVAYPGLDLSTAAYPAQTGCTAGSPDGFHIEVQQVSYMTLDNAPMAIVLVRCDAGTPAPSSLYAFAPVPGSTTPRLAQVLLAPPDPRTDTLWFAHGFSISGTRVELPAKGVTGSAAVCCPNVSTTMVWQWDGPHFVQIAGANSGIAGPSGETGSTGNTGR
jgi:hypothetical protein